MLTNNKVKLIRLNVELFAYEIKKYSAEIIDKSINR